jgi:hypothetical protein
VAIDITSTVSEGEYSQSKQRIFKAIEAVEMGIDMVTEGYTGIKKIKFITRACEGTHTVRCSSSDDARELALGFSMHAEISTEDSSTGDPS